MKAKPKYIRGGRTSKSALLDNARFSRPTVLAAGLMASVIGIFVVLRIFAASPISIAPAGFCPEAGDYTRVQQSWATSMYAQNKAYAGDPAGTDWGNAAGYNVPSEVSTLLEAAISCKDNKMISEIADVYLNAAGSLTPDSNNADPRLKWANATQGEQFLSSQQWFYGLARMLATVAAIPAAERTERMNTFVSTYRSVIAGYYKCWIWAGCQEFSASYRVPPLATFVNTMYDNVADKSTNKYALDDRYQWPMAAVPQLYLAFKNDPTVLDTAQYAITEAQMAQYIKDSARLLKQRSVPEQITNMAGQTVTGYNFDPGFWRDLSDNQYSGYNGYCFPIIEAADQTAANELARVLSKGSVTSCQTGYVVPVPQDDRTSMDLPHAWRFIPMYTSLYTVQPLVGSDFPMLSDMQKLANQVAYVVSNKDANYPKFHNYFSGSNGWYRPNYGNNIGFGFAPWMAGASFADQGWGLLSAFNPDLRDMTRRVRDILNSSSPSDAAFANDYYAITWISKGFTINGYKDYASNPTSRYWAHFLASVAPAGFTLGNVTTPVPTATPAPTSSPSPAVILSNPAAGSTISGTIANPMASVSNLAGVSSVQFLLDGNSRRSESTAPYCALAYGDDGTTCAGSWDTHFDLPDASASAYSQSSVPMPNGAHVITVRVLSSTGATLLEQNTSFTVNNLASPPTTPLPTATPVPTPSPTVPPTSTPAPTSTPSPTNTPLVCTKLGDVNCDGKTNNSDLHIVLANYGKRTTLRSQGDLTGDGVVNVFDLSQVLQNWGK